MYMNIFLHSTKQQWVSYLSCWGNADCYILCFENALRVHCLSQSLVKHDKCWMVIWSVLHAIIILAVWECGTVWISRICQQQCMYTVSYWILMSMTLCVLSMAVNVVGALLNLYSHGQQQLCMSVLTTNVYAATPYIVLNKHSVASFRLSGSNIILHTEMFG